MIIYQRDCRVVARKLDVILFKQHGYRAQERRRTGIGTSYGVTLREIKEYLLKMIPELQQVGIGTTTIAYLMAPPHRGHSSSKQYKSIVNAHVPGKDNCFCEEQHHLFTRVAYPCEFAQIFHEECCTFK